MSDVDDAIKAAVLEAQKFTRKHLVVELDFSPHSLRELEGQCDAVEYAIRGGKSPENIELLTRIWGAYLGEVLRRHIGGEWARESDDDPNRLVLRTEHETLCPHEQVRQRLLGGPKHSLWDYFEERRSGL